MASKDDKQFPLFETDPENISETKHTVDATKGLDSQFSKYIVYVDESGDHSLQNIDEQYPLFVLAFCVFHKGTMVKRLFLHLRNSNSTTSVTTR